MKVTIDKVLCDSCSGSGLYSGYGESRGVAVVCQGCDGSGYTSISYTPFVAQKRVRNIKKVFQKNYGFGLHDTSPGGLSYSDWFDGKPFPKGEDRERTCPAWWCQTMNYDKRPDWPECCGCGSFSDCRMFKNKSACWKKFDKLKM